MADSKKVGIIGYWFATNYGGVSSYFSLYEKVKELGYEPFLVENPYFETDKEGDDVFSRNLFRAENCEIAQGYNNDNLAELNKLADTFLLGSDQVLTTSSIKYFGKLFLMEFAEESKKRIAISSSCGGDNLNSEPELIDFAKRELEKFTAVSVREYSAVDILKDKFNLSSDVIVDPVFFTAAERYRQLGEKAQQRLEEPYVLAYILDPTEDKRKCIQIVSEHMSLPCKIALDGRKFTHEPNLQKMGMPNETLPELDYYQWLNYYCNASYVVTDSFHGAVLALILNKPFVMYANRGRGYPRFVTLAKMFGVESRLINNSNELTIDKVDEKIPFDIINGKVKKEIDNAERWLSFMLRIKGKIKSIDYSLDLVKGCTGCGACSNICPTQAIQMKENKDGFLNPIVNKTSCTNCGLCSKKCIALNPQYTNAENPDCYAVMADNEIREKSSSGGAFTVIADYVLKKHGIVCGAAFDDNFNVQHICVADKNDISKLRGSKYYQSNTGSVFSKIKSYLDKGEYVLFSGMPCQVAGLRAFLGKNYEKLFTIDILCHGISSHKVFEKYWEDILGGKKLIDLQFKSKKPWGWHAGVNAYFEDGTVYSKIIEEDLYYVAYIQGLSKNKPCGTCLFNRLPRQGDLTIGDFWRVQEFDKALNDNKGTSLVLINNKHGECIFNEVSNNFTISKKVPIEYAIAGNGIIKYPYALHVNRDSFFERIWNEPFSKLVNEYRKRDKESFLSSLSKDVQEFYYLSEIVVRNKGKRKVITWGENHTFRAFLSKYYGINVEFVLTTIMQNVNGKNIRYFDEIKGKASEYYIVVLGKHADKADFERFIDFGYSPVKDFIYRMINPIVLENYDLSKPYSDMFGNRIIGGKGIVKSITFRGYNNTISIAPDVWGVKNVIIDVTANTLISIDKHCNFTQPFTKIETKGYDGTAEVKIRTGCIFMDTLFRLFLHRQGTMVLVNEKATFGERMSLRANQGKRIIVGRDCMFSTDVEMWAGDGHTIMDVESGKPLNLYSNDYGNRKNSIVLGDHTWVGFRSFLMAGTNVGNGSVIGAQSVVKGVFPNNCSIAGAPAKLIRKNVAWSRDMVASSLANCGGYSDLTKESNAPISGKKVLVIGGTQFMGIQLVKRLIELGNKVTIANRGKKKDSYGVDVERAILDISQPLTVKRALNGQHFDVIFHNLAYCSNYVKNLLEYVNCDRYVQLSSFEVYRNHHLDIVEKEFECEKYPLIWNEMSAGYIEGKRQAECAIMQFYKGKVNPVLIRIPYVTKTERLYFYCDCIVNKIPMNIDDLDRRLTFIKDTEVGAFLPWIAAQDFNGVLNYSAEGSISIKDILNYIEEKTGKKAIIDCVNGKESPFHVFNEKTFSLNLDIVHRLGYKTEPIDSWIWELMDEYIHRAVVLAERK